MMRRAVMQFQQDLKMKDISELCDDFYERSSEIPFGNSDFQCQKLVIDQHTEPTRAYRQILLEMNSLIEALQESHFKHQEQLIDESEWLEKLESADKFERKRIELKLEKNKLGIKKSEKLIKDALHSLSIYNERLKLFPKYTRQEFENQEQKHFETVLANAALSKLNPAHNDNLTLSRMNNGEQLLIDKQKHEMLSEAQ